MKNKQIKRKKEIWRAKTCVVQGRVVWTYVEKNIILFEIWTRKKERKKA